MWFELYIWHTQTFTSEMWLKTSTENILKDQFYQKWASDISKSNKCINYRLFKNSLCAEKYLNILPNKLSVIICKF